MNPISHERVQWLNARLNVVEECIKLCKAQMYALDNKSPNQDLYNALSAFNSEKICISVELHVLKTHWDPKP